MPASDACYRWAARLRLSDTHVIRRTNQPLSATNDAETIDGAARMKLAAAAAVHNKTPASRLRCCEISAWPDVVGVRC